MADMKSSDDAAKRQTDSSEPFTVWIPDGDIAIAAACDQVPSLGGTVDATQATYKNDTTNLSHELGRLRGPLGARPFVVYQAGASTEDRRDHDSLGAVSTDNITTTEHNPTWSLGHGTAMTYTFFGRFSDGSTGQQDVNVCVTALGTHDTSDLSRREIEDKNLYRQQPMRLFCFSRDRGQTRPFANANSNKEGWDFFARLTDTQHCGDTWPRVYETQIEDGVLGKYLIRSNGAESGKRKVQFVTLDKTSISMTCQAHKPKARETGTGMTSQ